MCTTFCPTVETFQILLTLFTTANYSRVIIIVRLPKTNVSCQVCIKNAFEMTLYREILCIPWIGTISSNLNKFHLPTNWLYNFVRGRKRKHFGDVTRHNGFEKMLMKEMVTGLERNAKPYYRWPKDIT